MPQDSDRFDLSRARVCAILNAGSGKQAGERIATDLREKLAPACGQFDLRLTRKGDDLAAMARKAVAEGFDLIIAAGGDGTQAAVAGEVAGSDAVMGVVPSGTFNYFARDLGVGDDHAAAIETLLAARASTAHIGDVNGKVFLNNVSFGAYPEILERREDTYRRWGRSRIAAYWAVLAALWNLRRPMHLTTHIGGEEQHFDTALAFVAKSAFQLETFGLDGADAVRAGHFALLIARAKRPMPLIGAALRLAFGMTAKDSDFDLILADDITIKTRPDRQLVAHDGEKARMTGPFNLKVRRDALRVLVPVAVDESDETKNTA